jgi:hypothetical protein
MAGAEVRQFGAAVHCKDALDDLFYFVHSIAIDRVLYTG